MFIVLFILFVVAVGIGRHKIADTAKAAIGCGTEDIQAAMIELMKDKPELIIEAVNEGQKVQQRKIISEISKKVSEKVVDLAKSSFGPFAGNEQGDVTVYYFYDPNCGYCKMSNATINTLVKNDPNVKVMYKPLAVLGKESLEAVRAEVAVYFIDKAKFVGFHNGLMGAGKASLASAKEGAKLIGISSEMLDEYMAKAETQNVIDELMKFAQSVSLRGVTAFIIGDEYVPGALDLDSLKDKVKQQREEKSKK